MPKLRGFIFKNIKSLVVDKNDVGVTKWLNSWNYFWD